MLLISPLFLHFYIVHHSLRLRLRGLHTLPDPTSIVSHCPLQTKWAGRSFFSAVLFFCFLGFFGFGPLRYLGSWPIFTFTLPYLTVPSVPKALPDPCAPDRNIIVTQSGQDPPCSSHSTRQLPGQCHETLPFSFRFLSRNIGQLETHGRAPTTFTACSLSLSLPLSCSPIECLNLWRLWTAGKLKDTLP